MNKGSIDLGSPVNGVLNYTLDDLGEIPQANSNGCDRYLSLNCPDPYSNVGMVYELLLSLQRSVEASHSETMAKLQIIKKRIDAIESSMPNVVSAKAIDSRLRSNVINDFEIQTRRELG